MHVVANGSARSEHGARNRTRKTRRANTAQRADSDGRAASTAKPGWAFVSSVIIVTGENARRVDRGEPQRSSNGGLRAQEPYAIPVTIYLSIVIYLSIYLSVHVYKEPSAIPVTGPPQYGTAAPCPRGCHRYSRGTHSLTRCGRTVSSRLSDACPFDRPISTISARVCSSTHLDQNRSRCGSVAHLRRGPGADVARGEPSQMWQGASPVPAQMWQGVSSVPVQMWPRWAQSR